MSSGYFNPEESAIVAAQAQYATQGYYVLAGRHDPSVVPTAGPRGAIWIQAGLSGPVAIWQKQDNGLSTNWTSITAAAGSVTSVSVVSANGFSGTVADPTISPAITIQTTVTGLVKGNGTALSAAVPGVDYQAPGNYITSLTGEVTASGPGAAAATISNDAVTGAKILLNNNEYLRAKNSGGVSTDLMKLNASNQLDLNLNPYLPSDPIAPLQTATKQYVDASVVSIPVTEETRYVAKNGSDLTGTGASNKPFLTITAALNSITDASPTKRYVIQVAAGAYTEASVELKANVFIIGTSRDSVRITGAVSMAADFTGGADNRSGFSQCTIVSNADFNWNTVTSSAGKLYFNEVSFNGTVNLYGYNNAIAQAQFNSCVFFGVFTVSGINIGIHTNNIHYANIVMNQHPLGGMATILAASGGTAPNVVMTASVNNFGRRCSLFAREFWMDALTVDGPSAYADMTTGSVPNEQATAVNGGNLVYLNPVSPGGVQPDSNNNRYIGDFGNQWYFNFAYVHASTGTELYLTSTAAVYGPDSAGRDIFIQPDGYGLNANVNGGNIVLETAAVSGTGVRGKVNVLAREIDMNSVKIVNLQDPTANQDAATKFYVDSQISNAAAAVFENRTITLAEATAKAITLNNSPLTTPSTQILLAADGVTQYYGVDFTVSGATLSWNGLGLDAIGIVAGDKFVISYSI